MESVRVCGGVGGGGATERLIISFLDNFCQTKMALVTTTLNFK